MAFRKFNPVKKAGKLYGVDSYYKGRGGRI
jgi:hypothetical protein